MKVKCLLVVDGDLTASKDGNVTAQVRLVKSHKFRVGQVTFHNFVIQIV